MLSGIASISDEPQRQALRVELSAALARRWRPWRSYAVLHLWRRSSLKAT
jgi:3-methyladenine DNA glycosylase/8-oxoguanine DNA glycosylase